jgi:hypothetical protein
MMKIPEVLPMNGSKFGLILAVLSSFPAFATTYTSDINAGSDNNPGTAAQPFKTLAKCLGALRQAGDVCELRAGTYEAGGTVGVSGTSTNRILIQARSGEAVTIRQGGVPAWAASGSNLWSASFDYNNLLSAQRANSNYYERGIRLWQESKPLTEACFPNLPEGPTGMHPTLLAEAGTSNSVVKHGQIPSGDLRGARVVVYPYLRQAAETRRVNSSSAGLVNMGSGYHPMDQGKPFFLEGSKALIDQDWEWAWDEPTGKLWIKMPAAVDPNQMKVRLQTSSTAFTLQGSNYVTISGINFQGVVPVATAGTTGIVYERIVVQEPGILRFSDAQFDYAQHAGLVLRDGAKLTHSVVSDCNGRCVDVAGMNVTVEHSFIRNGTRLGMYEGTISIEGKEARIISNLIENSGHDGIGFMGRGVEYSIVRRNQIVNSGLQAYDAAGITVGAHVNGTVILDSNLVMNVYKEGSGIFIDEASTQNWVNHNVIGGVAVGIQAQGNLTQKITTFANNLFWNNTILPGVTASFGIRAITSLAGSRFSNNITTALPVFQTILPASISTRTSSPSEYTSWGAIWSGNLEAGIDPRIKDVAQKDFSLQAGSPAIDIGVVGSYPYVGSKPDAGAVESGSKPWVFGPYDDEIPHVVNPVLGFEDVSKWNPASWDNSPYTKVLSSDKTEGSSSTAFTVNGYKSLTSAPLNQGDINGTGFIRWNMKVSAQQPNPWWAGQVQIMLNAPSRNLYSAWIGQVDLTNLPKGVWTEQLLPIPANVASALNGATYSDFTISLAINANSGSGPLQFDDLRFLP